MADPLAQYADKLVYLCSAQASQQLIIVAQRKVETQIDALKLEHVKIDGMLEENKPARAAIWTKCEAKPGTYPIVLNMKTGDYWHGDELQVPQRHARSPRRLCHRSLQLPLPFCRMRSMPKSSRRSSAPSSKRSEAATIQMVAAGRPAPRASSVAYAWTRTPRAGWRLLSAGVSRLTVHFARVGHGLPASS